MQDAKSSKKLGIVFYTVFINQIYQSLLTFWVHLYSEPIFIKCPLLFISDQIRDRLRSFISTSLLYVTFGDWLTTITAQAQSGQEPAWLFCHSHLTSTEWSLFYSLMFRCHHIYWSSYSSWLLMGHLGSIVNNLSNESLLLLVRHTFSGIKSVLHFQGGGYKIN